MVEIQCITSLLDGSGKKVPLWTKFEEERTARLQKLSDERRLFLTNRYDAEKQQESAAVENQLEKALRDGMKPSEFAEKSLTWLMTEGFITQEHWAELLCALDRMTEIPYSTGWERRSYRSADYSLYAFPIAELIRAFSMDFMMQYPVVKLLTNDVPEEVRSSAASPYNHPLMTVTARITLALDANDEAVERAIRDMIEGDAQPNYMREVILGVLRSHRRDMHELIGKLLLAARLQEGLRQAICESADMGTVEALMTLVDVIDANNLIRFSSVKRAVGVWMGLLTDECRDLERVSDKSISLISRCLKDEDFTEACLRGEDSMGIHVALWALGVREAREALQRASELALNGTHHQRLTAGYFLGTLNMTKAVMRLSVEVLLAHLDERDTVAMYLPNVLPYPLSYTRKLADGEIILQVIFTSREQALQFRTALMSIRSGLKKNFVFEPCVFPWNKALLKKADVSARLCVLDLLLDDDALIDESLAFFTDCDVYSRDSLLTDGYGRMRTPKQRKMVLSSICDKSEYSRRAASKIVDKMPLTENDYAEIEKLLRYKYADVRPKMVGWLMKQGDDALLGSITRLLSDRKSEERRVAALDIMQQIAAQGDRPALLEKCRPLLADYETTSAKEKPMLDSLLAQLNAHPADKEAPLYTDADKYQPVLVTNAASDEAIRVYMRYFPESKLAEQLNGTLGGAQENQETFARAKADLQNFAACYEAHKLDPYKQQNGNDELLCNWRYYPNWVDGRIVLPEAWEGWYAEQLNDPARLLRMTIVCAAHSKPELNDVIEEAFGAGYPQKVLTDVDDRTIMNLRAVCVDLVKKHVPAADLGNIAAALLLWLVQRVKDDQLIHKNRETFDGHVCLRSFLFQRQFALLTYFVDEAPDALLPVLLPVKMLLEKRLTQYCVTHYDDPQDPNRLHLALVQAKYINDSMTIEKGRVLPDVPFMLRAAYAGLISRQGVYAWLLESKMVTAPFEPLTMLTDVYLSGSQQYTSRNSYLSHLSFRIRKWVMQYLNKEQPETEEDFARLRFVYKLTEPLVRRIIDTEIKRGDTETPLSKHVENIYRIRGAKDFIAILSAMGKDKLVRGWFLHGKSRQENLSILISVCVPDKNDTAEELRALAKQYSISDKRLIEAALYSPEWIELAGGALNLPGFRSAAYYFIAHMNEELNAVSMARIARFTPLSADDLQCGAFDIDWFRSAYAEVGAETFDLIYDAAKYITNGAAHARARKYADAVLGRLDLDATKVEIIQKRNKDLLMAYALIPLSGEDDLQARYLYIHQFLQESRSFGAQRSASEKTAAEMALTNLARNAGYADRMRLTLRMETRLTQENQALFAPQEVQDIVVYLTVDDQGVTKIVCEKGGKALKSIPAKYKKDAYVLQLADMKKQLVEQQRRAKRMLEEAMESSTVFTAGEIAELMGNPVIAPMLRKLVFKAGDRFGLLDGLTLTELSGESTALDGAAEVILAHPYHLYQRKQWVAWQQKLYSDQIVQPIRQIFRELYIKTPDELGHTESLRYAGNQIQPARTLACLKTRRWVADVESGLQKVYYKENIVATIGAMADWFTPADIEAPTLEWVAFLDRKTGQQLKIDDVPDILFSEVMRDVDLAVSVAHAGGIDPEASHSTIEMRTALLTFTLPLFRLTNVEIRGSHAIIHGSLADYSVHLGSGVVHQIGGTMLSVLPVHSQHRGKLFLPCADDDPKTAEILSKVLLFAEDEKIKDPSILEQIQK